MSWQEKAKRYEAEQQRKQEQVQKEELRRITEEQHFCTEVLKQLHCEEKLVQIRDELWQLGHISFDEGITSDIPVLHGESTLDASFATITLYSVWPFYVQSSTSYPFGEYCYRPAYIDKEVRYLKIKAIFCSKQYRREPGKATVVVEPDYGEKGGKLDPDRTNDPSRGITYDPKHFIGDRLVHGWVISIPEDDRPEEQLDKILLKDIINRQNFSREALPYEALRVAKEPRVLEAIFKEGLTAPPDCTKALPPSKPTP